LGYGGGVVKKVVWGSLQVHVNYRFAIHGD